MSIALSTKPVPLRELLNEQASGRGVLRLVTDRSLVEDRPLAKVGIRLLCPETTPTDALRALVQAHPRARAFRMGEYLHERKAFIDSLQLLETVQMLPWVMDLLLVILCEAQESGYPVYLIVDDDEVPGVLQWQQRFHELFLHLKDMHGPDAPAPFAVVVVPRSSCLPKEAARELSP